MHGQTHDRFTCDSGTRSVRFVRLALKVVMQKNGDFVEVMLLQEDENHTLQ
jgi:hypothetical protein